MSARVDQERAELTHEARAERAKEMLRLQQRISTLTYEGVSVSDMAKRLGISRMRVQFLQRVLGWRSSSPPPSLRGRLWGEAHPL